MNNQTKNVDKYLLKIIIFKNAVYIIITFIIENYTHTRIPTHTDILYKLGSKLYKKNTEEEKQIL